MGSSKIKCTDDLNQISFAEGDGEGDWLMDDIEEILEEEEPEVTSEKVMLYLPSNFSLQQRSEYGLQELGNLEYELREGQANDSLERLRECLAEKSLRFRTEVRPAKSQKKMTRAWDSVHRMEDQIKQTVVTYRAARHTIKELGEAADLERFQEIQKPDLKMSGDIVEENRVSQRSSVLPWFWRLDRKAKGYVSRTCKLITQIVQVCKEIRSIKNNKSTNTICSPPSTYHTNKGCQGHSTHDAPSELKTRKSS